MIGAATRHGGRIGLIALAFGTAFVFSNALRAAAPERAQNWQAAWPRTDFTKHSVDLDEIRSGGPPKDGIPSIDDPKFVPVSEMTELAPSEPVIGLEINGDARAYPLRILTWHEIANDTVGGVPVAVTYCPLCNAAIVFDRRIDGRAVEFGTTGKLRYSDLVMYDRETESWWQQFSGEAIVGARTGTRLKMLPARLESWQKFAARHPDGRVLVPNDPNMRPYGANPYVGYDSARVPFLYDGELPRDIEPLARVVVVGDEAWSFDLLRRQRRIESGDLILTWEPGQNSALDTRAIAEGRDVGNVLVQRRTGQGLVDVRYDATFAFVFKAFRPDGVLHK
ncbi:MAG: DUF3179 domain-containing protein [Alphaproteobacteria bacterium]|nr:MAG: DUF3179 domain-containing protein [Alphaproteobacteria bacterium]